MVIQIYKPGLLPCFHRTSFQAKPLSLKLTPKAQEIDDLGEEGPSGHGYHVAPANAATKKRELKLLALQQGSNLHGVERWVVGGSRTPASGCTSGQLGSSA